MKKENKTQCSVVAEDMKKMHAKYGVHDAVESMDAAKLKSFLKFRLDFLQEEVDETFLAFDNKDAEEVVDGLIDLVVVAVGTLDLMGVDFDEAWGSVLTANLSKIAGENPSRPNPFGLPDLIKPEGWTAPSHEGNHGLITAALEA
jgi:predicted HAD superfamily Cof-like phosphohydrolase